MQKRNACHIFWYLFGVVDSWLNVYHLNMFTFISGNSSSIICSFCLIFDVCASLLFVSRLRRWFMQFSMFKCYNFPFQLFSIHSFYQAQTSTKCYLMYWLLDSSYSRHFFLLRLIFFFFIYFKSVSSWNLFICASRVGIFFLFFSFSKLFCKSAQIVWKYFFFFFR